MPGDLSVHSSVPDGLRSRLSTISGRLEGACGALGRLDAEALGAPPLVTGVDEFAAEWRYGIEQIGKRTEGAVSALTQIGKEFDRCDRMLARACQGDGEGAK